MQLQYTLREERTFACSEMETERGRSMVLLSGSRKRSKSCSDKDRVHGREDNLTRNSFGGLKGRSKSRSNIQKLLTENDDSNGLPMKQDSNDTGLSTLPTLPTRLTRSQNPAFVAKQRSFLQKVTGSASSNYSPVKVQNEEVEEQKNDDTLNASKPSSKRKRDRSEGAADPLAMDQDSMQKSKTARLNNSPDGKLEKDKYCWTCHKEGVVLMCHTCPRSFHLRCAQMETVPYIAWMCPECATIMHAENVDTRSVAMKQLTLDRFCSLLKFSLNRLKSLTGSEPFWRPVDLNEFSRYREFVVHPMDFSQLEYNIRRKAYGSTEAFIADVKWILHDCIVFNTQHTKLTSSAKYILKVCKQEMAEIEICPDCYYNANTLKDSWFIEACRKPHVLVWAKLKGYPFWPGKVLRVHDDNADVRFFGAHDRAWVNVQCCYLYSKEMPAPVKSRKHELQICIKELEQHTKKLKERFGRFQLPPSLTPFDPTVDQLPLFLPNYKEEVIRMRRFKSRSRTFPGDGNENMGNHGDPLALDYEVQRASHQAKLPKQKRSKTPSIDRGQTSDVPNGLTTDNSVGRASLTEWSKFEEEAAQIKLTESDIEDSETSVEVPCKRTKCETTVDSESSENFVNETTKSFGKSGIVDILQKKLMSLEPICDIPEFGNPEETKNISDNSSSMDQDPLQLENEVNSDSDSCSKILPNGASDIQLKVSGRLCEVSDVGITSSADNTASINEKKTDFLSSVNAPITSKDLKELLSNELPMGAKDESNETGDKVLLEKETTKNKKDHVLDKEESNTDGELIIKKYCSTVQEGVVCSVPAASELKVPGNESVSSNSVDSRDLSLNTERLSSGRETPSDSHVKKDIPKGVMTSVLSSDISLEEKLELPEKKASTELVKNSDVCTETSSDVISCPSLVKQFDNVTDLKTATNKLSKELSVDLSSNANLNIMDSEKKQTSEKYMDCVGEGLLGEENFRERPPYCRSADLADITTRNDTFNVLSDTHNQGFKCSADKLILLSEKGSSKVPNSKELEKDGSVISITETSSDAVPEHGYSRRTTEEITITVNNLGTEKHNHNKDMKSNTFVIQTCAEREEEEQEEEVGEEVEQEQEVEKEEEIEKEEVEEEEEGGEEGEGEEEEEEEQKQEQEQEEEGQQKGEGEDEKERGGVQKENDESLIPSAKSVTVPDEDVNRVGGEKTENISENSQLSLCDKSNSGNDKGTTSLEGNGLPEISVVKSVPEQQWVNLTYYEDDDSTDTSEERIVIKMSADEKDSSESQKETSDESFDKGDANKITKVSTRPQGIRIRDVSVMCVKRIAREMPKTTTFKEENKSDIEPASGVKISEETHTSGDGNTHVAVALNQSEIEKSCIAVNQNINAPSVSHPSTSVVFEEQKEVNVTATDKYSASENEENIKTDESNIRTINTNEKSNKSVELVKATDDIPLPFEMVCEHESDEDTQNEQEMMQETLTNQTTKPQEILGSSDVPNDNLEQCMQDGNQKSLSNRSTSDISPDATTKILNTCKTVLVGIKYSKQASVLDIPGRATPESVVLLPNSRGDHGQYHHMVENSMDDSLDAQHRSSPALRINQSDLACATSDAGPNTAEFHRHAEKIAQICCSTLQEILRQWSSAGDEKAIIKAQQLEIEKINWHHKQEIAELRHNADLIASELRANLLAEHRRLMNEAKHRWETEKKRAIEETKKKQWCSYCGKEAIFYCCWNTSYCDTNCQSKHWPQHVGACQHMRGITAQEEPSASASVVKQSQVFAKPVIALQPQKSAHLLVPSVPLPTINRQPGVRYASYTAVNRTPTILGTAVQVVASKPQQSGTILAAPTTSGNVYFTTTRVSAPPPLNRVNSENTTTATVIYPSTSSQAGSKKTAKVTQSSLINK